MAALDKATGNVDPYLEKLIKEREEEAEKKKKRLAEMKAANEASTLIEDRKGQDKKFVDGIKRDAGIIGGGLLSNLIDVGTQNLNPNRPSKLETTGKLLYADEEGKMPEGQTGAGALYSALGQAVATDEANQYAEDNIGSPTEVAASPLEPRPIIAQDPEINPEDPTKDLQEQSKEFAAELTKTKQQQASVDGVLDGVSGEDVKGSKSDFGSDFFSAMTTLATFGAMIATGVGIPFALAAAASAWSGTGPMRQRESTAEDLRKKGYDDSEITKFVYDGVLNQIPNAQAQADSKENLAIKRMEKQSLADARAAKLAGSNSPKELTESQEKSLMAFRRSSHANAFFTQKFGNGDNYPLASDGSFMDKVGATINRGWARMGQDPDAGVLRTMIYEAFSPEVASAMNQEIQYLSGILRKESGAAISRSEWENYGNIFFPRPHDGKDDINRKSVLRQVAAKALSSSTRGTDESFNTVLDAMVSQGIKNVKNVGSKTYVQLNDGNVLEVE